MTLYAFDIDGTLVRGFISRETCEECGGEGRLLGIVPTTRAVGGMPMDAQVEFRECPGCKGKGGRFRHHLPYDEVEVLPDRLERLAELQADPTARFALVTNQGGVAFGHQTREQVENKTGRVLAALGFFGGAPTSVHIAWGHPNAKVEEYRDPDLCALRKPLPGMLYEAMDAHRAERAETLFVGDLPTDRDCAEAAGVAFEWARDFFGGRKP